jgi:outer membrane protein W
MRNAIRHVILSEAKDLGCGDPSPSPRLRMTELALTILLLFVAAPLLAQDRDMQITAWVSRVDIEPEEDFAEGFETDFDDGSAIGLSVNRFVGSWLSVEAAAFGSRNDARLLVDGVAPINLGKVSLTPVSFGAQLHLPRRPRFDPYVGAGAAYVMASDLSSPDLQAAGVGRIELDDKLTWYVNAGIGVHIAGGLGIVVDGRYVQYETDSRSAVTGVEQEIDLSPRLLSVGLRLRF